MQIKTHLRHPHTENHLTRNLSREYAGSISYANLLMEMVMTHSTWSVTDDEQRLEVQNRAEKTKQKQKQPSLSCLERKFYLRAKCQDKWYE